MPKVTKQGPESEGGSTRVKLPVGRLPAGDELGPHNPPPPSESPSLPVWRRRTYGPDELRARVVLLENAPCEAAVLQRQFLQQHEVHVIPDADGEDADLASGGLLGVVENLEGVGLPDSGFPIGQEDDEGHAAVFDVVVGHIVVEQLDGPLQGPVDVCAWGTPKCASSSLCACLLHLGARSPLLKQ